MSDALLAPPLAHLGHWYVSLPVFGGPVLALAIAVKVQSWREARKGPDNTGKRSTITVTQEDGKTIIAVTGPLDYPALLELEVELGKITDEGHSVLIDLRNARADEQASQNVCDVISQYSPSTQRAGRDNQLLVLIGSEPAMHALRAACEAEGVPVAEKTTDQSALC